MRGLVPSFKQERDMTDEAVSGGAKVGAGAAILSALCEVAGDLAKGVGANGAAYTLYTAAEGLLH
jgi:hypothetical protein